MNELLPYTDWNSPLRIVEIPVSEIKHTKKKRKKNTSAKAKVYKPMPQVKIDLLNMFGAKCYHCGYNTYLSALVFHHIEPQLKKYNMSALFNRYNLFPSQGNYDLLLGESKKCVLLCSNCHLALHAGEWSI